MTCRYIATNISIFGKTTKKCRILSDSNKEIKVLSIVKSSWNNYYLKKQELNSSMLIKKKEKKNETKSKKLH